MLSVLRGLAKPGFGSDFSFGLVISFRSFVDVSLDVKFYVF